MAKKSTKYIIDILALLLCMAVAFAVCMRKSGMHEDEFYSFYSSNRTDGLWLEGRMDSELILKELCVLPGEGFNFGLVKEVQSWDVHPPIYYFVLHFICSCMPGVFSAWQGLGINLVCLCVSLILMKWLGSLLMRDIAQSDRLRGLSDILVTCVCVLWGISSATLTGVVFVRMYMLLTVWILAVTILHIYAYRETKLRWYFYVCLGILSFLGFMTHYYFFIWLFFLAVAVNVYNLARKIEVYKSANETERNIWQIISDMVFYGLTMILVFGVSYVFYPAWPAQMFKGQRGAQATGNFFDFSNTWQRICFFAEKVNRIGFGGVLPLGLIVIISMLMGLNVFLKTRNTSIPKEKHKDFIWIVIMGFSLVMYFLVISKTALVLGDSSIRYQMPVIGIGYLVIMAFILEIISLIKSISGENSLLTRLSTIMGVLLACFVLLGNVYGDFNGNISFLYPEKKKNIELMRDCSSTYSATYIYTPSQEWCVWGVAGELLAFDEILFVAADQIEDEINMDTPGMLFVDNTLDINEIMDAICKPEDTCSFDKIIEEKYCDIYEVRN